MTFNELREYDFGVKFGEEFKGEKIPALEEMLDVVKPMKIINIEIKQLKEGILENPYRKLCEILCDFGEKIIISSFNIEALRGIYEADSKIYTAYLCDPKNEGTVQTAVSLKCRAIHPYFGNITWNYMKEAKKNSLEVNAWTANSREEILFCGNMECNSVITNEPALARMLLKN